MKTCDECDSDKPIAVDVIFDGSWMTRGHASHIIAANTRVVFDFEVLRSYSANFTKKNDKVSTVEFEAWYADYES